MLNRGPECETINRGQREAEEQRRFDPQQQKRKEKQPIKEKPEVSFPYPGPSFPC
jgi:hypothetical protein